MLVFLQLFKLYINQKIVSDLIDIKTDSNINNNNIKT